MDNLIFKERISSNWTEGLFVLLSVLFFCLLLWQVITGRLDFLGAVFLFLCVFFFFYSVNYRTLQITLTQEALTLTFGIFTWRVPIDNIEDCRLDEIPLLLRFGGAGVHFMIIGKRYRASFNFLEYPRLVITLRQKVGLMQDISFSTRHPEEIMRLIHEAVFTKADPRLG